MIPRLLDGSSTDFTRIGIPLTDCISCTVQEERNGVFELTAVVSTTTPYFDTIKVGMLIVAKPNHTQDPQAFEIYEISKPINQQVTIRANHISYRQSFIPVKPFSCTGITATLSGLISNAMETSDFTFSTDISNETSTYNQIEPASMRSRLGGVAGSVLDVFGGEYEWDNFETILHLHRGAENGVQLRLGKNITNLEQTESLERVVTGVLPYWSNSDGTLQYYGDIQYSSAVDDYPTHRTIVLDLSSDFESTPTKTQLNNAGQAYLAQSNLATPNTNVAVQFVDLADTTEYADSPLERVNLCDTVEVIYPALDISSYKAKAIKVVFDVLAERTLEVEVGDTRSTISKTIADVVGDIDSQVKLGNKLVSVTQTINREIGTITSTIGEIEEDVSGVTERVTQVEQTTEGITQTVSEHTTQISNAQDTADDALSKANTNAGNITTVTNRVSTVEQTVDGITQRVESVEQKVEDISIGATNLLVGTSAEWSDWYTPTADATNYSLYTHWCYDLSSFKSGTDLTVSYDLEFDGANAGSGGESHIYLQSCAYPNMDNSTGAVWNRISFPTATKLLLPLEDGIHHYSYTVTIPDNIDYTDYARFMVNFRTDYWDGTGKVRVRFLMLEVGNIPTDWSPAPEDFENTIATTETRLSNEISSTAEQTKQTITAETQTKLETLQGAITTNYEKYTNESVESAKGSLQTWTSERYDTPISNLQDDVGDLQGDVSSAQSSINTMQVSISALQTAITSLQNGIGKAFVVDSTGTKVYAVENNQIIQGTYTLTDELGNHYFIDNTETSWATATEFGCVQLSIGKDVNDTARWRTVMNENTLDDIYHA